MLFREVRRITSSAPWSFYKDGKQRYGVVDGQKLKKKHVEDAIVSVEKFHFLFTAVTSQRSSGGISGMYASLGRRLFEARDTQEAVSVIQELRRKLRSRVPSIEEFKALFPTIIVTENVTKQKKLVKYVLVGLDRFEKEDSTIDYDQMTIEHLAPQSLIGRIRYDDALIGQFGNLILISEELNGKLRDRPFKDKKRILQDSDYSLPKCIASASIGAERNPRTDGRNRG